MTVDFSTANFVKDSLSETRSPMSGPPPGYPATKPAEGVATGDSSQQHTLVVIEAFFKYMRSSIANFVYLASVRRSHGVLEALFLLRKPGN